jgi:hypothetical protein
VIAALQRGNTMLAIKLLRQSHGLGLKQAKDLVNQHQRLHPNQRQSGPAVGAERLSPGEMPRGASAAWPVWLAIVAAAAVAVWALGIGLPV